MATQPEQFNRRSFIHAKLAATGAAFTDIGGAALATGFPGRDTPALGLADLSPVGRIGVKGPNALAWVGEQGWPVPAANNSAERHDNGGHVVRLSDRELLILAPVHGDAAGVQTLAAAIPGSGVWGAPRQDSHFWFRLQGKDVVACLQKLCGVDLRLDPFPSGAVAQTSVARLNCIVVRDDATTFHLLADSASAAWFWDVLLDAMNEFGGGPVGA